MSCVVCAGLGNTEGTWLGLMGCVRFCTAAGTSSGVGCVRSMIPGSGASREGCFGGELSLGEDNEEGGGARAVAGGTKGLD
jgi:hypothetical protein